MRIRGGLLFLCQAGNEEFRWGQNKYISCMYCILCRYTRQTRECLIGGLHLRCDNAIRIHIEFIDVEGFID